jgi:hypothetical protein
MNTAAAVIQYCKGTTGEPIPPPAGRRRLDLDRCAQRLAQYRAHFLARWTKARGVGQQPDAPLDHQPDPAADTAREVVHSD